MAGCFSIEPRTEPWSVDCRRKAERIPGEYGELGDMRPLGEVWPLMEALEASAASLRSDLDSMALVAIDVRGAWRF